MPSEMSAVTGDQSAEELRRELAEARAQQAATAEILRVISSSPTDLQHVFAEIAASAARLCDAYDVVIRRLDGDSLPVVAHHGPIPTEATTPLTRGFFIARVVLDQRTIHVADMQAESHEYPESRKNAPRLGLRTALGVPLIRAGEAIGAIAIRRAEVRPFTERQIELVKTFADQAVIAIENTRLFEAEQASKRELQDALEQQMATAEVLKVISRSAFDVQKVLDALVESAARLTDAYDAAIFRVFGDTLRNVAHHGQIPFTSLHSIPVVRGFITGRAVIERRTVHVADVLAHQDEYPESRNRALPVELRTA